ncbi:FecR family protein [Caulobacter hibisci]|uniref:FecR domain-containing protein n=1 Tax=Caulobacter hibisci TaxID=2035993 RepID=A0ABS0T127_9CAUL|nr:FecR domain-containing protein [Caulobacter hibisci]MBI1685587.1 FecR domain-containing protein [Caulobacter hibisci]
MTPDLPSPQFLRGLEPKAAAALWLEQLQRDPSPEADAAFAQWIEQSDANRRAWDGARDLWDVFEDPQSDEILASLRKDALSLRAKPTGAPTAWYLAAASIAAAVIGGVLFSGLGREHDAPSPVRIASADGPDLHAFGQVDYQTAAGQRLDVRLEDGTRLRLEPGAAVDIAYVDGQRLVRMPRGEASFEVRHDETHPFRVAAGGRVVSDLGTRLNIQVKADETRVRLDEGSLGVTVGDDARVASGAARILVPGQQLIARRGHADKIVQAGPAAADAEHQVIQLDNVSLAEAVAQMNRYTGSKLVVVDPKVAALRVSGAFRTDDPARFATTLTTLYPVRLVPLADGRTEIAPRGKSRR